MKKDFIAFYFIFLATVLLFALIPSQTAELSPAFIESWKREITPSINYMTLEIVLNNLFVILALWLFSLIPIWMFYRKPRTPGDKERFIRFIYIVYILYFAKEGIRIGLDILGFSYTPYIFTLLTLILPHGITEIGAFALTGAFALNWAKSLDKSFKKPHPKHLIASTFLVIFSGILETTLTPYVFKTFL